MKILARSFVFPMKGPACAMKNFFAGLLLLALVTGHLLAADTKKPAVPGGDDLSRYAVTKPAPGSRTTLRDSSGRTTGTASTTGTQTILRDSSGRTTGTATVQGNQTVFRDSSG